jgi:PhnB protein
MVGERLWDSRRAKSSHGRLIRPQASKLPHALSAQPRPSRKAGISSAPSVPGCSFKIAQRPPAAKTRRLHPHPEAKEEAMTEPSNGSTAPHTITVHLVVRGADRAANWYVQALGAEERGRVSVPDGRFMQIELRFGDSTVMIADEFPEMGVVSPLTVGGVYSTLSIHTDDVEALWERAVQAGAEVVQPLQDMFWGDRHGEIIDPFGHKWALAQHVRDVPAEEIRAAAAALFGGESS